MTSILQYLQHVFLFQENSPLLFTQFYFWAFFAVVFAVFSLIHRRRLLRNAFLAFVSLFFYYKTSGLFVLILLFVTCSDFLLARRIHASTTPRRRRLWLICSIVIDLGLLCYFKYAYFFADIIAGITGIHVRIFDLFATLGNLLVGGNLFDADRIVLPVGISFFTFQIISYTVDVYRRQVRPVTNILDFAFYVSFFPQLVAGPIVRASEFIPQLYKPYHLSRRQFGIAVFWILNGLVKKIVLSDYLAVNFIDRVFDNPHLFTGFENLSALFLYSLQVYADFSGYTDIAIGVAMLMGFYLPQNFNSPYKAPNASNFWKRWHMSLSRWLQSYLYIPLGGNRHITFGTYFWLILIALIVLILSGNIWVTLLIALAAGAVLLRVRMVQPDQRKLLTGNLNSFITMLLGGLWHGASWNFMIWGGLNGIGMIIYKFWRQMSWPLRMSATLGTTLLLYLLVHLTQAPVFRVFAVWMSIITLGTAIRFAWHLLNPQNLVPELVEEQNSFTSTLANAWAIAQTFTFITFTRLFFRSGSNLDPATANREAWATAQGMIHQIGSPWTGVDLGAIVWNYRGVFALFLLGMVVHWLPSRLKRRYRIAFSRLPLPLMMLAVVAIVFVVYQFITADLQAFIYFQF